jgi:hypothetical protein
MTVELSLQELLIINNALNEICNGISLHGEFSTRIGCSLEDARELLEKIHSLARRQGNASTHFSDRTCRLASSQYRLA